MAQVTAIQRFRRSFQAFRMAWSGRGGNARGDSYFTYGLPWAWGMRGDTKLNLVREVGDPAQNGAVSICLQWIAKQFPEPDFQVCRVTDDGTYAPIFAHPLDRLLTQPNPYYDGDTLWAATIVSYSIDGNAYWIKARGMGGAGSPIELWYVPHWQLFPRWDPNGNSYVDFYEYRIDGKSYQIPVDDVVHFRNGLDYGRGGRIGTSPLYPVLGSILSDNEAESYTTSILRNMGIPGVVLSPKDVNVTVNREAREELGKWWDQSVGGDNRGRPLVPSVSVDVTPLGLSPEQLRLQEIRQVPEDRIAGALAVPAMVAGLSSGAAHKTYANYEEARSAAYQDCIIPMQRRFCRTLDRTLLADLGNPAVEHCRWNYDNVRCLQPDQDALALRWVNVYRGGLCTLNEARLAIGLLPRDDGDEILDPAAQDDAPRPGTVDVQNDDKSKSRS